MSATCVRLERVDQVLADIIVHLGEHVAVEQVGDRARPAAARSSCGVSSNRSAMSAGWSGSTSARARLVVARLDRVEHRADEFGLQPVVLVELIGVVIEFGRAVHGRQLGLAHRLTLVRAPG